MRTRRLLSAALALPLLGCNDPPEAGVLAISPSPATTTDALVAVFEEPVIDNNGDDLTLEWTWMRDGVVVQDLTTDRIPAERTAQSEVWTAGVVAMDVR